MKKIIGLGLALSAILVLAFWTLNQPKDQALVEGEVEMKGQVPVEQVDLTTQEESEASQRSNERVSSENQETEASQRSSTKAAAKTNLPRTIVLNSQGEELVLADMLDKPTFINFWASWCPPCKEEMPYIQKAYEEYGDQVNFVMLNATQSRPSETIDQAKAYIEEEGYSFPIYFDQDFSNQITFSVTTLPSTIVLDQDGKILRAIRGVIPEEELFKILEESLQ